MKIVQINTVFGTGSTGNIVADIYKLSDQAGFEPLVAFGRGKIPNNIHGYKIGNFLDFTGHVLINFFQGKSGFGSKTVTRHFLDWLDEIKPNILHLHNIHGFYLHVGLLFDYIRAHNIPIVWTLHDCWPLTGQCAFFEHSGCDKWKSGCRQCPVYRTDYPYSLFKDNSLENYIIKKHTFTNIKNMTIVTPSQWLAEIVRQSYLSAYPVITIPNGIDLDIFKPMPKGSYSSGPKIILGVANIWDHRKGVDYFLRLAKMLDESYHIVLIGLNRKQQTYIQKEYGKQITALTRTSNRTELALWYNRAYAYVNPTLEDNFPTTNLEALACGTPVITFRTGGSPESIIDDCGIVVEKGNLTNLYEAILSLEDNKIISPASCRSRALKYDKTTCFQHYLDLYTTLQDRV